MFVMREARQVRVMRCIIVTEYRFTGTDILITVGELDWVVALDDNCFGDFQPRTVIKEEYTVHRTKRWVSLVKLYVY